MLVERFDALLFDLDGVVYLGDELLPGSRGHHKRSRRSLRSPCTLGQGESLCRSKCHRRETMTPKLGCVGLGNIGEPLVRHLLLAGYEVLVHDTSAEAVSRLDDTTARPVGDLKVL